LSLVLSAVVIILAILLSAFFSGTETGIYCANRARLQLKVRQGDVRAARLAHLLSEEGSTLTVTLIGVNLADYLTTTAAAFFFLEVLQWSEPKVEFYTIAFVAPVLFVFANVVPKNLFQMHADVLMPLCALPLQLAGRILRVTGAIAALRALAASLNRLGLDPIPDLLLVEPKRKIAALLRESLAGHDLGSAQSGLIDQVLQLSEVSVQSVMVTAGRVNAISRSATREELIRFARSTTHSRLPVYGTHRRNIIGLINIDAMLASLDWRTVGHKVEPPLTIGPYETIASALSNLQKAGQDLAVVVDKTGSLLGIVTLRTLLDVILGALAAET